MSLLGRRRLNWTAYLVAGVIGLSALVLPVLAASWLKGPELLSRLPPGSGSVFQQYERGSLANADMMLENEWPLPRSEPVELTMPLSWTEDPFEDKFWRFNFYGLRPLQDLLWAWYRTRDEAYLDKLHEIVSSFVRDGGDSPWVNERADLHASAWRAMALVNIYVRLSESGDLDDDLAPALHDRIALEGEWLADDAHFQAGGNHGVNQAVALLLVAAKFPDLPEAPRWLELATERLETMVEDVVDPDGVEIENSPYYHFYVLNALWRLHAWAERSDVPRPASLGGTLSDMARFAGHITMPNGKLPLKGASLALDINSYRPDLMRELREVEPSLAYFFSGGAEGTAPPRASLFPESGLAILRGPDRPDRPLSDQTWALLDAGPWRTHHSHLDRLSVLLYSSGRVLLPDAGLYSYPPEGGGERAYYDRDFFYSTAAHNTVVVNGANQSREAEVGAGLTDSRGSWAYQSGWHRLYNGVKHRRAVLVLAQDLVLVVDRLDSASDNQYAQTWHLAPDLTLSQVGLASFGLDAAGNKTLAIHQILGDGVSVRTTADDELTSWHSESYGRRVANEAVAYDAHGSHTTYVTLIATGSLASVPAQGAVTIEGEDITASVCVDQTAATVRISALAEDGEKVVVEPESRACVTPPDPPEVRLVGPADHVPATGLTTLAAEVDGPVPIDSVEILVDGKLVGEAFAPPYEVAWDSTTVEDGSLVTVTARAVETTGRTAVSPSRALVVSNSPHKAVAETAAQTVVSLTFDDGLANQFQVGPMLDAHDMRATFYVNSGRLDLTGKYMTREEVDELHAAGHDIGGHTVQHLNLSTVERSEQLRQICGDRVALLGRGYDAVSFAFPFGARDPSAVDAVHKCGYNSARTTDGLGSREGDAAESIPPERRYEIRAVPSFQSTITLRKMENLVKAAEQTGGGWVIVTFHSICPDSCAHNAVAPTEIQAFIDWLSARASRGTVVRTVADVVGGPLKPGIDGPRPHPADSEANLLRNPSLEEEDPKTPDRPRCWVTSVRRGTDGTPLVEGTFAWTPDAHSGRRAQALTVTTGNAPENPQFRLETRTDMGGCSPRAAAGHSYKAGLWYKSDVDSEIYVQHIDNAGRIVSFKSHATLPSSPSWTYAEWTTPTMPDDTRFMAIRYSLPAVGTATVDDFSLVDAGGP